MNLSFSISNILPKQCDLCVIPVNKLSDTSIFSNTSPHTQTSIKALIKSKVLSNNQSEITPLLTPTEPIKTHLLIGTLPKSGDTQWRTIGGTIGHSLHTYKPKSVTLLLEHLSLTDSTLQALIEGIVLGCYRFTQFKTKPSSTQKISCKLVIPKATKQMQQTITQAILMAEATNLSRDLANTPSNHLTPDSFVNTAKKLLKEAPIQVKVITATQAKKLGMNALLGVGQGSHIPPRLLVMEYRMTNKQRPIALVGKGVTFDSGGISIKPSKGMSDMKADMSGAAAVLAAMVAIGKLSPKQAVLGLIPLAENMPDGNAQRPGDVVTAMNGKTIEILNTDAEGRLILADALCYAVHKKSRKIVDIATLTGACGVALGELATGLIGNNENEINTMKQTAKKTGERVWQLPAYEEYLDYLESTIADIAHCSEERYGGTCTAAKFLEQFVDDTPWVHLDIASVMIQKKNQGTHVKGMSGEGARNLIQYILDQN